MKHFQILILAFLALTLTLSSCKKDDTTEELKAGTVVLDFDHVFGPDQLEFSLNKEFTHPLLGEKMNFNIFQYYVSNVRLKKADGSWHTVPESYYLLDLSKTDGNKIEIDNVPGGEYTDIELLYGVDSTRNVSGAQTGALDPANGMFWSWNSGYIMVKAEGTSPNSATGTFTFHLGGFKGEFRVPKSFTYSLNNKLVVDGDREAEIHMISNVARLWHSADKLSVKSSHTMPGQIAKTMSGTFYDAIKFDHIHN
jgi:hypothetical protein